MVHSIELVFDPETEAAIRRLWARLADGGIAGPARSARPHVTLSVAERIDPDVDAALAGLSRELPCVLGAPVLFGRVRPVLARLVVPTSALLARHAEVHRVVAPYAHPAPMPHTAPGDWTPHVTLARRVGAAELGRALPIAAHPAEITGSFAGLRRWDGGTRTEYPIS